MTCVVGVVSNKKIYLGADSAGVAGYQMQIRSDRKVFRHQDFLFGFAGSFRMGQILKYNFKPPLHRLPVSTDQYLHTSFVDALRGAFIAGGFTQSSLGQEFADGLILFGYQGKLYCVEPDFQISESVDDYMAIGCGAQAALGSLFSTADATPEARVQLALEASERYSAGVRRPFYLLGDGATTPEEGVELQAAKSVTPIVGALQLLEASIQTP